MALSAPDWRLDVYTQTELTEAIARARSGSGQRIRELLQSSPRRAHVLLRASIRRGVLTAGRPVEEQSLIMSMMMSRNSIRSALSMLGAEGLIERRQRIGTSVVASIPELPLLEPLPIGGWTRAEEDPDRPSVCLELTELERQGVGRRAHPQSVGDRRRVHARAPAAVRSTRPWPGHRAVGLTHQS